MLSWITPFFGASIISVSLAFVFAIQFYRKRSCYSLTLAALFNSFWLFSLSPSDGNLNFQGSLSLFFECMHYSIWILAISRAFPESSSQEQLKVHQSIFWLAWGITLSVCLLPYLGITINPALGSLLALGLTFSTIWCTEKLYRFSSHDRQIKMLSISIGILLFYDLFYHSYSMFDSSNKVELTHLRASVYLAACFIMAIGLMVLPGSHETPPSTIKLSQKAAFYGSTLLTSALLLTLIFLGGYYIQSLSGSWLNTLFIFVTFTAVFAIVTVYTSRKVRAEIVVFINKHFYSHVYNYREEWLKISNILSQNSDRSPYELSLEIMTKAFNCDHGMIWVKSDSSFTPKFSTKDFGDINLLAEPADSEFVNCMIHHDWIFYPAATCSEEIGAHNNSLPAWAPDIPDLWIISPLLTNNEVIAFVALTRIQDQRPTWEDLDLLRTIGSQLAAHIKLHIQEEKLEEQLQLNVYNKLSSFVMHDLNNLIAQQDLVVKNADKHISNPAFVADAISTVQNSVKRMKALLYKLKSNKPEDLEQTNLQKVIKQAIQHNINNTPHPELSYSGSDFTVLADKERLMMSISHLIKNAQDATPDDGNIFIDATQTGNKIYLVIRDTGVGMSSTFIRDKLFKPFESTKTDLGMGIGVYLTRDYIQQLGGNLAVSSQPGKGTTFKIELAHFSDTYE
ncbi:XrtA/PEP-CTERM system histidine kinase PrsK [Neptuniibacter caesariensis]|uniref:histidine kinase n=1 Tax=Neptuniibacter caesariensis TaxID=207954 RepID=A0A7U8C3S4_NEPCE|nr:XrtA/PEP-CTERM system histidine kinase PrsK [Neptuniibacter caesariensis]EAR59919.1 Signal transduction histidine kinase [Oceanospirillum sp. MED92] [Neptuniibacter caesariensis]